MQYLNRLELKKNTKQIRYKHPYCLEASQRHIRYELGAAVRFTLAEFLTFQNILYSSVLSQFLTLLLQLKKIF